MLAVLFASVTAVALAATPVPTDTSTPVPPIIIYPRAGDPAPSRISPHGPGLVLMGGGPTVDPAFAWMHDTIVGSHRARGGDVVVLTASDGDEYTRYIMAVAPFNSVRSIQIGPAATAADLRKAASFVDAAQGVFFSGGDQAHYVKWKGTALAVAVQHLYDRGGVVGGTSAGLAILGEYAYDSVAADAVSDDTIVTTSNAVRDPDERIISFTHAMFDFAPLRHTIADTHFVTRDRLGRLAVFLGRLHADTSYDVLGLGIEQGDAVVVDKRGVGTLMQEHHHGAAYLVRLTGHATIVPGGPFSGTVRITRIGREDEQIDFDTWCARAPTYTLDIDGARTPPYDPSDWYDAPKAAKITPCPSLKALMSRVRSGSPTTSS